MPRDNKPDDWVVLLLRRFQQQLPSEVSGRQNQEESTKQIQSTIINLSGHKFSTVVSGLAQLIKNPACLASSSADRVQLFARSNVIVLDTLALCFERNPEECAGLSDDVLLQLLLPGLCQFITKFNGIPFEDEQRTLAAQILSQISVHHFSALFNQIAIRLHVMASSEDSSEMGDLELIRHLNVNVSSLKILLQESINVFKQMKKPGQLALVSGVEKAIWNWVENRPDEFAQLQREPSQDLSVCASKLFDLVDHFAETSKTRKAAVWPLQIMLVILCPDLLKEIATCDKVTDSSKINKKEFLDHLKKALSSTKTLTESAAVVCVKLCRVATYIKPEDNSVLCFLVLTILNELKALLFNVNKPFNLGSNSALTTEDLMEDCFVSSFRINYRNNQHFDICLQPSSPIIYKLAFVKGTYNIVKEAPLRWWPKADVLYGKAQQVRNVFLNVLNAVQNTESGAQQSRMSQIYKVKDKRIREEEAYSSKKEKELLLWLVKLFRAEPLFAFHNPDVHGWEIQKSSSSILTGVTSLMLMPSIPLDIRKEATETLLFLFQVGNIELWNPVSPIATFWEVSSTVMVLISDFLINNGSQDTAMLKHLRDMVACRNDFLHKHTEQASIGSHIPVCAVAQTTLEEVLLSFLWNPDVSTVLIALSCFGLLCEQVEIVQSSENVNEFQTSRNFGVYSEMSLESKRVTTGRAALQKRVMSLLRQLDNQTTGSVQAWEKTYHRWKKLTFELVGVSKEEPSSLRRRTGSGIVAEGLENCLNEWIYMTGFLCSLGGVCATDVRTMKRSSRSISSSVNFTQSRSPPLETESAAASGVSSFIKDLLDLLLCSNERTGLQMRGTVNDVVGADLSPKLYPALFNQITAVLNGFFSSSGQVIIQESNTVFLEQIIVIIRNVLENKNGFVETMQMSGTDSMILSFVRYVWNLPLSRQSLQIKTKLCQLVDVVMGRREALMFHQEVKFRNKLVEYLTDWVLHSSDRQINSIPQDLTVLSDKLDAAVMRAIASLLSGLPLQPVDVETDLVEAKSQLFLKYFTLFMNLMSRCKDVHTAESHEEDWHGPLSASQSLHQSAILAMSNLLNANIDTGLMHAIGLGYHDDLQTRAVFVEVLTKVLQQGTEFDNLADTVLMDRFDRLVNLLTLNGEHGELPIVMALANVVPSQQLDELSQVLVNLFGDKHMLPQLFLKLFSTEVHNAEGMATLFRGNSLASKTMKLSFQTHGNSYLHSLLEPLVSPMYDECVSYEVDPSRLEKEENIEENRNNLIKAAQNFVDKIADSLNSFPVQLQNICHCLKKAVHKRFPKHSLEAVGSAIFLRFINPAITSPRATGIVEEPPDEKLSRGLMLLSKILQNLANHVLFTKEKHMEPFNGFLLANFDKTREFFYAISAECDVSNVEEGNSYSFMSDSSVLSLHKLLWENQDKIGAYLMTCRAYKNFGRGPFEKMSTLLAQLGPPDQHKLSVDHKWQNSTKFEEFMARHAEQSQDDLQDIKTMNVFYQGGKSKSGYPLFYYIARRFRTDQMNDELLIYHALLTLEPCHNRPWELVIDFSHANLENRFSASTILKLLTVVPDVTLKNLMVVYMYNCSSTLRQYAKYNERLLSPLKGCPKVKVADSLIKLHDYIKPSELKLPSSTMALTENLKVFQALRISTRSHVLVKVGSSSIQLCTQEKHRILGYSSTLNDVYYASEIKGASLEDDNTCLLKFVHAGPGILLMSNDGEQIVEAVTHVKTRWQLSQPDSSTTVSKKIQPKDVPGTLLNMALLNLGTRDPSLRLAAYNLLCAVTKSFNLKIEERLLEGSGLCIPANNTMFIVGLSEKLAAREPQLTLEFLEECISGFTKSDYELKHLCLEYMAPWLPNLAQFGRHAADDPQKVKMTRILEKLIRLTVSEKGAMYPSVQATIWGNIGQVTELVDTVLDSFIKASVTGGLGSVRAEVMAETAVALASANVQVVSSKVIGRLHSLIQKTCMSPTLRLEQHLMWDDIAILTRYLLMLSFNDCLDVASHIPYLFHLVTLLVSVGPATIRASIHGLLINVIQSLCTCSYITFTDQTQKLLRLRLAELSSAKFYLIFGISKVKAPSVKAFTRNKRGHRYTLRETGGEPLNMAAIETIADLLLEIMEGCLEDMNECTWLEKWTDLTAKFAFQLNPSLQSRSIVTLGCISKTADDKLVQQVIQVLVIALSHYTDTVLIEATVMCLTRLQGNLTKDSKFHKALFWIAVAVLQLSDVSLYPCGLALLEQSLISLESHKLLESQPIEEVLMILRKEPLLEFHCKQMDHFVGLNFYNNFHFALMAHLVKGVYHPHATTSARAIRILNLMLNITSKFKHSQDKFAVCQDNIAYLTALLPVSKEIRNRLRLEARDASSPRSSCSSSGRLLDRSESTLSVDSQVSIVITLPADESPCDEEEPFAWPTQSQFLLLDPGIVDKQQSQALLLTTLVTLLEHISGDAEVRFLYEVLAQASIVFPKIFPVIYTQLDSSLSKVLGHSHDVPTLQAVETIIQSMSCAQITDDLTKSNYLATFGFSGFSQFTKFKEHDGQNNRAQLLMKFLETLLEVYGHPDVEGTAILHSSLASFKPLNLSSSSGDLRSSGVSLSSSLVSIPGVVGNAGTFIPMPFKRSGSSYRMRKSSKDQTKTKRHLSVKGLRKNSLKGGKL